MELGWKTFVSKIHPPLPMTPQESQRLLALLNASFKEQFDHHRPSHLEEHAGRHLHSILTNPLFAARPRSSHGGTILSSHRGRSDKSTGLIQDFVKRPMDIFRERIAAGTATLQTAKLCLQAESKNCLASPAATVGDAMRSSNTASIILDWLGASHAETLGTLLENSEFFRLLVLFLVAEKRHDRIWSWLQTLQSNLDAVPTRNPRCPITRTYNGLLITFIKAEAFLGEGLDAATGIFVRAINEGQPKLKGLYAPSAWYLTRMLMKIPKPAQLQYTTVQAFMEATGTSRKPNTLMSVCHWAYLAETQDLTVALRYLESVQPGMPSTEKSPTVGQKALKNVESLSKQGSPSMVWDVASLRKNFRREIGDYAWEHRLLQGSPHTDEESSLRLLGGLAVH